MNAGKIKKKLIELRTRQYAKQQELPHEGQVCSWCEQDGKCHCHLKFSVSQNARLNAGLWK